MSTAVYNGSSQTVYMGVSLTSPTDNVVDSRKMMIAYTHSNTSLDFTHGIPTNYAQTNSYTYVLQKRLYFFHIWFISNNRHIIGTTFSSLWITALIHTFWGHMIFSLIQLPAKTYRYLDLKEWRKHISTVVQLCMWEGGCQPQTWPVARYTWWCWLQTFFNLSFCSILSMETTTVISFWWALSYRQN